MSLPQLDGPRLPPSSGTARQLVVLLHGYGADGNDLISLGERWQQLLPGAAFVAPNAPDPASGAPSGYQWFPISHLDPQEVQKGVELAAPALDAFLDTELTRHSLGPENLVLAGFSQGSMLALHVGLRRKVPPAAIVGFSGLLAGRAPMPPVGGAYPPILLSHGDSDPVVPPQSLFLAVGALQQAGAQVKWYVARGVAHGIDAQTLELAGQFVQAAFASKP